MRFARFLFFIFTLSILLFSGCLREYNNVEIISVDVMPAQHQDGTKLIISPYIQNNQNRDTGVLTMSVKIRDPSTNLIVARKEADIGYIKSRGFAQNSISLFVNNPGNYIVEVQLFEDGKFLTHRVSPVTIKPEPGPGEPADIKLTDMVLVVTRIYNDASAAIVDVSPGIYNQGGDSGALLLEVTARADQYTAYTETDELGIVKSLNSRRGKVTFDLPRNREYSFTVRVIENGKTLVAGEVNEKIRLNTIKYNTPMTYVLVEEGKPAVKVTEGKAQTPGFEAAIALLGLLLVYLRLIKSK